MTLDAIRLGIVGCGYGTNVLAPAFTSDDRVRLVAISGRDVGRARQIATKLGVKEGYGNWCEMLEREQLDAIAVAVPPGAQPEVLHAAMASGLAVFAEKPLALSFEQARGLARHAQSAGLANMVDFNFSEVAQFRAAKALLDDGALGTVYHVVVTWHAESYANRMNIRSWKTDHDSGGGALSNFVSHSLHYLEWMLGPISALSAVMSGIPDDPRHNDTFVNLAMRFSGGCMGALTMSAAAYCGSGHNIEVYGKDGALMLENPGPDYMRGFQLRLARRPDGLEAASVLSDQDVWDDGRVLPASRLARRFIDWTLGGAAGEPSFGIGLRVQFLLEAARKSSASGVWIDTSKMD